MKNETDYKNYINDLQQKKNIIVTRSDEYESKECKLMIDEELLQPVTDQDDHASFCGALACIFDIDHCIIGRLSNLDYIQTPFIKKKNRANVNYIQWITLESGKLTREPIDEVLSILLCDKEYLYGEPYDNSELLKHKIKTSLNKVTTDHGSIQKYLSWVSERLWMESSFIEKNYFEHFEKAKKIDNKMGNQ